MILGKTFISGVGAASPVPIATNAITVTKLENGIIDECYMESSVLPYSTTIPTQWNFNTNFDAKFNGDILAGNIAFAASEVSTLRLKRRKKGTSAWITIFEKQVNGDPENLSFTFYDRTCRAATKYEYTIVPVIGQVEGSFYASEIETDFCGLFLIDSNFIYQTELDVTINDKRTKPRNMITTINRKVPYVISNGAINYDSGTTSAQWVPYDPATDMWDMSEARDYVSAFEDFLNDGKAKLMKYEDGRMWLIELTSSDITNTEEASVSQVHTSFDWASVGDPESASDLYTYGFSDVEV